MNKDNEEDWLFEDEEIELVNRKLESLPSPSVALGFEYRLDKDVGEPNLIDALTFLDNMGYDVIAITENGGGMGFYQIISRRYKEET